MESDWIHETRDASIQNDQDRKKETSHHTELSVIPKETGKNATFITPNDHASHSINPATTRSRAYRYAVYDDLQPLHALTYRPIPSWKEKKLVEQLCGSLYLSRELRAYFSVLNNLREEHTDCELAAVMVSFSQEAAQRLVQKSSSIGTTENRRSIAGVYELLINKRLSDRGIPAAWFGIIGYQRNPRRVDFLTNPYSGMHTHCIVAYHREDKDLLKEVFRKDKSLAKNSMSWDTEYNGGPINVGAADYLSKHINQPCPFMETGRNRLYAPNDLKKIAKFSYEQRRALFRQVQKAKHRLGDLTLREVLLLSQFYPEFLDEA
ncbi:hypothetical protein LG290_06375 [Halomonas sediminis]